jgi:hypothetical protein
LLPCGRTLPDSRRAPNRHPRSLCLRNEHGPGPQKSWRRIDGHNQLPKLILGVKFADGIEVIGTSAAPQAAA